MNLKIKIITLGIVLCSNIVKAAYPSNIDNLFSSDPDKLSEMMAVKFDGFNDKLSSLDDVDYFNYDQQGNPMQTIQSTTRILRFSSSSQIDCNFDISKKINRIVFSLDKIQTFLEINKLLNTEGMAIISEDGFNKIVADEQYIVFYDKIEKTMPSGMVSSSYLIEIKRKKEDIDYQSISFNIDSLSINTSGEMAVKQIVALFSSKGIKLIDEDKWIPQVGSDNILTSYRKSVLFTGNINVYFVLFPSRLLKNIYVNTSNPLSALKYKKILFDDIASLLIAKYGNSQEQVFDKSPVLYKNSDSRFPFESRIYNFDKQTTISLYKNKAIFFQFYFDKNNTSKYLKNTIPFQLGRLIDIKNMGREGIMQNLLTNVIVDMNDNSIQVNKSGYYVYFDRWNIIGHLNAYYLSPSKKLVEVIFCDELDKSHPIQVFSKDLIFLEQLKQNFNKSDYTKEYYLEETDNKITVRNTKLATQENQTLTEQNRVNAERTRQNEQCEQEAQAIRDQAAAERKAYNDQEKARKAEQAKQIINAINQGILKAKGIK